VKIFSLPLLLVFFRITEISAWGQNYLRGKYREWIEDNDRVEVRSWYAETEIELENDWSVEFLGTIDAWSGATPNGRPPKESNSNNSWLTVVPEEVRKAGLLKLNKTSKGHDFSVEYGISDEPDYLSRSYAFQYTHKMAADTFFITSGLSMEDDSVKNSVGDFVGKTTPTFSLGLTRIIDAFTSITFNVSYSWPSGYLSDPYKKVPINIGPVINTEPENRPDKRNFFVLYSRLSRYLESLKIGMHFNYRYFLDDYDLEGNTLELETIKRVGDKWVYSASYRFYHQNQTSFYDPRVRLPGPYIISPDASNGPFYSADHRLSSFNSQTVGLKVTHFFTDKLHIDAGYDRYFTRGQDNVTDQRVYPNANIFTLGLQWVY
jgi:hypothetical protein